LPPEHPQTEQLSITVSKLRDQLKLLADYL
jgi:hypothetical protein